MVSTLYGASAYFGSTLTRHRFNRICISDYDWMRSAQGSLLSRSYADLHGAAARWRGSSMMPSVNTFIEIPPSLSRHHFNRICMSSLFLMRSGRDNAGSISYADSHGTAVRERVNKGEPCRYHCLRLHGLLHAISSIESAYETVATCAVTETRQRASDIQIRTAQQRRRGATVVQQHDITPCLPATLTRHHLNRICT